MPNSSSETLPGKAKHLALCFLPQTLFIPLFVGAIYGGLWLLVPALMILVLFPSLDLLTGWQDDKNFDARDFTDLQTTLLLWNPRVYALFYGCSLLYFLVALEGLATAEIIFTVSSLSLLGAIGFSVAHELLHKGNKLDDALQRVMTSILFYPHYKIIHTRSHHIRTATPDDKNTAWFNEGIYTYILRTIPESLICSWELEMDRLDNRGQSGITKILLNKLSLYAVTQIALLAFFFLLSGLGGLFFYAGVIAGSNLVLESVNYIQHYGLMRDIVDDRYEKNGAEHSWDTYHCFSSYATYRVGHHAYHHNAATMPYHLLKTEQEAPKLPVGYFWAIVLVLLPPIWRRTINPKIISDEVPSTVLLDQPKS